MLDGKQKRYLRGLAQNMDSIFQIGKGALSDTLIDTVDKALEKRELIKINVLRSAPDDIQELAFDLAMYTHSEIVQIIGHRIVLYRRSEDPRIILP